MLGSRSPMADAASPTFSTTTSPACFACDTTVFATRLTRSTGDAVRFRLLLFLLDDFFPALPRDALFAADRPPPPRADFFDAPPRDDDFDADFADDFDADFFVADFFDEDFDDDFFDAPPDDRALDLPPLLPADLPPDLLLDFPLDLPAPFPADLPPAREEPREDFDADVAMCELPL